MKVKTNTARVAVFALTMAATAVVTLAALHPSPLAAKEDVDALADPPLKIDGLAFIVSMADPPRKNGDMLTLQIQAANDTDTSVNCGYTVLLVSTTEAKPGSRMPPKSTLSARQERKVSVSANGAETVELTFNKKLLVGQYDVRIIRTADAAKQKQRAPLSIPDNAVSVASFTIAPSKT